MTFEEWWDKTLDVGYTSAKKLARDSWEAATKAEREACAKLADERIYQGPDFGELAREIRNRSNKG